MRQCACLTRIWAGLYTCPRMGTDTIQSQPPTTRLPLAAQQPTRAAPVLTAAPLIGVAHTRHTSVRPTADEVGRKLHQSTPEGVASTHTQGRGTPVPWRYKGSRCLMYPLQRTGRALPAQCPGRVLLVRIPFGQAPFLHPLRGPVAAVRRDRRFSLGCIRRFRLRARVGFTMAAPPEAAPVLVRGLLRYYGPVAHRRCKMILKEPHARAA